jgi:putative membrane protein
MMLAHGKSAHTLTWVLEPSVVIGLALLAAGYALVTGPLRRWMDWGAPVPLWQRVTFYAGTLAIFITLVSPLDSLADEYLFSAHMVQHMLLTFIGPPLWLLGIPEGSLRWLLHAIGKVGRGWQRITRPIPAFIAFNGVMWAWHYPPAYNLALEHEPLHILEHLIFIAAAVVGWWPVASPIDRRELPALERVFYLIALMLPCTALAALITLSPNQLYSFYANASTHWGLSPLEDQQLGGLAMWMSGDLIFASAIIVIFYRWLEASSDVSAPRKAFGSNQ